MKENSTKNAITATRLSEKHHMTIHWLDYVSDDSVKAKDADLRERTMLVGHISYLLLSAGTGAWRVLDSMDSIARELGMTCTADIGLVSLNYTCFENGNDYSMSLGLPTTGVNTDRLNLLENFVNNFHDRGANMTLREIHSELAAISTKKGNYSAFQAGLASGIACFGFTFLLGGGLVEMIASFIGAGGGNWLRRKLIDKHISLFACIIPSVALACILSILTYRIGKAAFGFSPQHEAGYICAMLFVIPGFPLITGGIDLAKSHMRSGIERMTYAVMIITVATLTGWCVATFLHIAPEDFIKLNLSPVQRISLRLLCSFLGVFGFSEMFNSPRKMAFTAGIIGMLANTLRLELVTNLAMPGAIAAFIGALTAGLLASVVNKKVHYPRISISVPSIVIMVPGMYLYRGVYLLGASNIENLHVIGGGAEWLVSGVFMILALPLGLVVARILTDSSFRITN